MTFVDDLCSLFGRYRCAACKAPAGPLCPTCARALVPADERSAPPGVDRVITGWSYEGGARALVLGLKLRGVRGYAEPLAGRLTACIRGRGFSAEVITWVPGRRRDIAVRGFDHAEVLARAVARASGLVALPLLARAGHSADQAGLGAEARRTNLVGAFQPRGEPMSLEGCRVGLVDDLITTGATARACATALGGAGAKKIELLDACSAGLD